MFRNLRRMQFDLPNEEGFAKNTLINSFAWKDPSNAC
jgi:hypothetical protein